MLVVRVGPAVARSVRRPASLLPVVVPSLPLLLSVAAGASVRLLRPNLLCSAARLLAAASALLPRPIRPLRLALAVLLLATARPRATLASVAAALLPVGSAVLLRAALLPAGSGVLLRAAWVVLPRVGSAVLLRAVLPPVALVPLRSPRLPPWVAATVPPVRAAR